jgi:hypothetical protein
MCLIFSEIRQMAPSYSPATPPRRRAGHVSSSSSPEFTVISGNGTLALGTQIQELGPFQYRAIPAFPIAIMSPDILGKSNYRQFEQLGPAIETPAIWAFLIAIACRLTSQSNMSPDIGELNWPIAPQLELPNCQIAAVPRD